MTIPFSLQFAKSAGRWAASRTQAMILARKYQTDESMRRFYVDQARWNNRMSIHSMRLARADYQAEVSRGSL